MSIYNLTEEQILELIARGENELVEFKDANTNPEQIGKYCRFVECRGSLLHSWGEG